MPLDETLQKVPNSQELIKSKINLSAPESYAVKLTEHRSELQDSRITFIDHPEPSEINYLNFDPQARKLDPDIDLLPNFSVTVSLDNKIKIQKRVV